MSTNQIVLDTFKQYILRDLSQRGTSHNSIYEMKNISVTESSDSNIRIQLFTNTNCYSLVCSIKDDGGTYLGCQGSARMPRAGEDWTRGNDLPDGEFSEDTWRDIMSGIIGYELVNVHKPKSTVAKIDDVATRYISNHVKTTSATVNGLVPFKLRDYQTHMVESCLKNMHTIIEAPRQCGASTTMLSLALWQAMSVKKQEILIYVPTFTQLQSTSALINSLYENISESAKMPIVINKGLRLIFENESIIQICMGHAPVSPSATWIYFDCAGHFQQGELEARLSEIDEFMETQDKPKIIIASNQDLNDRCFGKLWTFANGEFVVTIPKNGEDLPIPDLLKSKFVDQLVPLKIDKREVDKIVAPIVVDPMKKLVKF